MGLGHYAELVRDACEGYGIEVNDKAIELMVRYLELVYERNRTLNLTSIPFGDEAVILHLVDSIVPLALVGDVSPSTCFLDVGTGGGFPGVPFGIATGAQGLLIDSVGKKVTALQEMVAALGIEGQLGARCTRAEDLAREDKQYFDFVLMRAVAPLETMLEYAAPLLAEGGRLIAYKGIVNSKEIDIATMVAPHIGMSCVSRETFELPQSLGLRDVSIWMKAGPSDIQLPRRTGMAKKRPLSLVFHVKQ